MLSHSSLLLFRSFISVGQMALKGRESLAQAGTRTRLKLTAALMGSVSHLINAQCSIVFL